ncbi:MAG: hypothetical protein WAQ05_07645 [Rubrivivax sp.]
MSGFLKRFPILSVGFSPDFVDDKGIPLLEPDSPGHGWHRARIGYVPCTHNDVRRTLGLPMNLPALKTVLASPDMWTRGARHVAGIFPMKQLTALERIRTVANTFHCLPYIFDAKAREPIPHDIANLFKFYRGIASYASRRTLVGLTEPGQEQSMYEYVIERSLAVSEIGVCPASKLLMDRIEGDLESLTLEGDNSDWSGAAYSRADLAAARSLGSHFDHFAMLCAVLFVLRKREEPTRGPSPQPGPLAQFPLPCVSWLTARNDQPVPAEFFAGMRSTLRTLEPLDGITIGVEQLVDECESAGPSAPEALQDAMALCWELNRGASEFLRREIDSNAVPFNDILGRLIDARLGSGMTACVS